MKTFVVDVYGYDEERFDAATKAKAMWLAFKVFSEARPNWDFHKFLINTTIREVRK